MVVSTPAPYKIDLIQRATVKPLTEIRGGLRPSSSNLAFASTRNGSEKDEYCLNVSFRHAKEMESNLFRMITWRGDARWDFLGTDGNLACSSSIKIESLTMLASSKTLHSDESADKTANLVDKAGKESPSLGQKKII